MTRNDFWKKAMLVLLGIFVFRIGSHIPVPGIDPLALSIYVKQFNGTMVEILNTFSGGSVKRFAVLAVGIMPYISASIVIQMFGFFSQHLKQLKAEGERGQLVINKYVRYLALFLTVSQAITITKLLSHETIQGLPLVINPDLSFFVIAVLSLTSGTMFLLWLGERLTDYGIGSGISTIIFAGIISNMPSSISHIVTLFGNGQINIMFIFTLTILAFILIYLIVFIEHSQRRVKLSSGNDYSENSYLPIKINISGIMPAIFASTIIFLPFTFNNFILTTLGFDFMSGLKRIFGDSSIYYMLLMSSMIMFFSFFYSRIVFNPKKTSENLQASGTFITGIRPGKPTEYFLNNTVSRLTLIGGSYMVFISIIPEILVNYFSVPFYLGGTSLLIMILISKEWYEQYELSNHKEKYDKVKNKLLENFN